VCGPPYVGLVDFKQKYIIIIVIGVYLLLLLHAGAGLGRRDERGRDGRRIVGQKGMTTAVIYSYLCFLLLVLV